MSKCFEQYFEDEYELTVVKYEFGTFSGGRLPSPDALKDIRLFDPLVWWEYHGASLPKLQSLMIGPLYK